MGRPLLWENRWGHGLVSHDYFVTPLLAGLELDRLSKPLSAGRRFACLALVAALPVLAVAVAGTLAYDARGMVDQSRSGLGRGRSVSRIEMLPSLDRSFFTWVSGPTLADPQHAA